MSQSTVSLGNNMDDNSGGHSNLAYQHDTDTVHSDDNNQRKILKQEVATLGGCQPAELHSGQIERLWGVWVPSQAAVLADWRPLIKILQSKIA